MDAAHELGARYAIRESGEVLWGPATTVTKLGLAEGWADRDGHYLESEGVEPGRVTDTLRAQLADPLRDFPARHRNVAARWTAAIDRIVECLAALPDPSLHRTPLPTTRSARRSGCSGVSCTTGRASARVVVSDLRAGADAIATPKTVPDESLGDDKSLEQILDDVLAERRDEGRLAPLSQVFSSGNNDEASQPGLLEHERNPDRRLR